MKKIEEQYLEVLENHGWAVSSYTDDVPSTRELVKDAEDIDKMLQAGRNCT